MGVDRGVEGGGGDPLVLGQQVVGVFVEVGDAADARGAGDEVVAARRPAPSAAPRPGRRLARNRKRGWSWKLRSTRAVFREVVEADDLVAGFEELLHQVAGDEAGGPGHKDPHR